MRSFLNRPPARLALATIFAGLWLGVAALGAEAAAAAPLLTYISGLGTNKPPTVMVCTIAGTSPVSLGAGSSALLSPNGALVAAVSSSTPNPTSSLLLYPTAGVAQPTTLILNSPQFMNVWAWSPDSRLLLVAIGASTNGQLLVFDTLNATSTPIASGVIDGASFAPGGSNQIVFARAGAAGVNLYTTSSSGTHTRQITHDGHSEYPLWGPGGLIVYSHLSARPRGQAPASQLWSIKPSGAGARQLTNVALSATQSGLKPIGFSASGKHLLANLSGKDSTEAYVLDNLTSAKPRVRDLTGQDHGTIGDAISQKGNTILLTKGTPDAPATLSIETVTWAGTKARTIVAHGAYASWDQ